MDSIAGLGCDERNSRQAIVGSCIKTGIEAERTKRSFAVVKKWMPLLPTSQLIIHRCKDWKLQVTVNLCVTYSVPVHSRRTMQGQYLIAVGVGGGPVPQLSSRPVGSAGSPHTGVGAPNWSSKVGLASGSSHTQLHCIEVGSAQEQQHMLPADGKGGGREVEGGGGCDEDECVGEGRGWGEEEGRRLCYLGGWHEVKTRSV